MSGVGLPSGNAVNDLQKPKQESPWL